MDAHALERIIGAAAGELAVGQLILLGVGLPTYVVHAAQQALDGSIEVAFESGSIGSRPPTPPLSIGDPTLVAGASAVLSLDDMFGYIIGGGRIDTAFVGVAEVDQLGHLNSTLVYDEMGVPIRLPGSGGACEIVFAARNVVVLTPMERRRFPARVGFTTCAPGPETSLTVVTDRAIFRRPAGYLELEVSSLAPGETLDSVQSLVGWPLKAMDQMRAWEEELNPIERG